MMLFTPTAHESKAITNVSIPVPVQGRKVQEARSYGLHNFGTNKELEFNN